MYRPVTTTFFHVCRGRLSETQAQVFDVHERALGLGMIRRVCERWGWRLEENVGTNGDHGFALHFRPTAM